MLAIPHARKSCTLDYQVLLHARRRQLPREFLHVGRDHHRLDLRQGDPVKPAPVGEPPHRDQVGAPRTRVPDVRGEEFPEFPLRLLRAAEQRQRHPTRDPRRDRASLRDVWYNLLDPVIPLRSRLTLLCRLESDLHRCVTIILFGCDTLFLLKPTLTDFISCHRFNLQPSANSC